MENRPWSNSRERKDPDMENALQNIAKITIPLPTAEKIDIDQRATSTKGTEIAQPIYERTSGPLTLVVGAETLRTVSSFNDHQQEQMCDHRLWKRDSITKRPGHQTAPLKGLSPETFDIMAAYDSLVLDLGFGKRIETNQ
jgi:hypothetical protein